MSEYRVWIEHEQWEPDGWNLIDGNTDVRVTLKDGTEWIATFFTYQNVLSLRDKNRVTGECLSGKYFWATNMILVDELSRSHIEAVVAELVRSEEFRQIFEKLR